MPHVTLWLNTQMAWHTQNFLHTHNVTSSGHSSHCVHTALHTHDLIWSKDTDMHAHESLLYTWPCTNSCSFMLFNTVPGSPTFTLLCKLIALFIHELGHSHHLAHYSHAHASNLIYRQSLACYPNLHTYPLTVLHPHSTLPFLAHSRPQMLT